MWERLRCWREERRRRNEEAQRLLWQQILQLLAEIDKRQQHLRADPEAWRLAQRQRVQAERRDKLVAAGCWLLLVALMAMGVMAEP